MDCPDCGAPTIPFDPGEYADTLPGEEPAVALCTRCLALHPVPEVAALPEDAPDFGRVSADFPGGEAAVPFAVLVGLLDSLALYRSEVSTLLAAVERAGTDPLLALDRLAADPELEPAVDLGVRRKQLEQLL
jgi:hypothetical protein